VRRGMAAACIDCAAIVARMYEVVVVGGGRGGRSGGGEGGVGGDRLLVWCIVSSL